MTIPISIGMYAVSMFLHVGVWKFSNDGRQTSGAFLTGMAFP
jgi:hypothetical protein